MSEQKILIVEDEFLIARDLSKKLENMGYQVVDIVSSGQSALNAIADNPPDLILMDIVIKGNHDGIDTAKVIEEKFHIPIIYVTAYADDATMDRVKQTGAYGYILKPVDEIALRDSIDLALKKSQEYQLSKYQSQRRF